MITSTTLLDKFRAWPWLVAALIAIAIVAVIAPHQVGLLVWSLSKVCLAAWLAYWIDRSIFYYARPGDVIPTYTDIGAGNEERWRIAVLCMIRRALIIAAAVIALSLGV